MCVEVTSVLGNEFFSTAKKDDEEFPLWKLGMKGALTSMLQGYEKV